MAEIPESISRRRKETHLVIDKKLNKTETTVLSASSSIAARTIAAPVERIKLLMQCQDEMIKQGKLKVGYVGIRDCYTRAVSNGGYRQLWRGNVPQVIRCLHMQEINLLFKDRIMRQFTLSKEMSFSKKLQINVVSGGLSGVLTDCFLYSFDFARTQMAVDCADKNGKRKYKAFYDVYTKIYKSDGFRGLYRGFGVSCVGIFIYRGLYFGLYDSLKPIFLPNDHTFFEYFVLAYAVTMVAMQAVYPFDTMRRRMMVTSGTGYNYKSSFHCLKSIYMFDGVKGLFKGSTANVLRGTTGALVLAVFDRLKHEYLERKNEI